MEDQPKDQSDAKVVMLSNGKLYGEPNERLIAELAHLLQLAKDGEICAIAYVVMHSVGERWQENWAGIFASTRMLGCVDILHAKLTADYLKQIE